MKNNYLTAPVGNIAIDELRIKAKRAASAEQRAQRKFDKSDQSTADLEVLEVTERIAEKTFLDYRAACKARITYSVPAF
jgi:hypothetical protein